ncbi:unnamed protein product, partial [Brenthis ino]
MKTIVLFALFVLAAADLENYTTLNDHLDMDALVGNITAMQSYVDCFLDRIPCSEVAASYKRLMPEAVKQACSRCNANQKYQYGRFLEAVRVQLPIEYDNYRKHYDPDNKYFDALIKELSNYTTRVD